MPGSTLLRERLTLLAPVKTPDGQGGETVTYTETARVRARMAPAQIPMEVLLQHQLQAKERAVAWIDAREARATGAMRVQDPSGKLWRILAVGSGARFQSLTLEAL